MKKTSNGKIHTRTAFPVPYGANVLNDGVCFTLCSRHARRVWLMLFDAPDAARPVQEIELRPELNRVGDIWHIHVEDARAGQFYAYRMEGPADGPEARFYNPKQWLLDPYALAVSGAPKWADPHSLNPGDKPLNGASFPRGMIVDDTFDWEDDQHPSTPLHQSVIYETHLRGFTVHPSSGVAHPGTYRGFAEKISYLRDLGITAVEFLPIQEFNEMEYYLENTGRKTLRNFWGYSTLAFFAPNARYAAAGGRGGQVREFQEMVKALHKAGIEVILDVVFNHTAEGGDGGPTYSFRGIDNSIYYIMEKNGRHYANYSGCGNTVNCNHPVVRDFILDCLRYWVLHMRVDGFRFDLASVLTRGTSGDVLPNPPAVEHIAEEPALRSTKIIAEAWDAAGVYQVGSFPNERWSEWNGRFRDDVRRFWRGDPDMLRTFAARMAGSPDLYNMKNQTPQKSINYVCCHDGFTLHDLVSYEHKHNEANGEENRDGDNHNHSSNWGVEGDTGDSQILAVRRRQQRNMLASVLLARGVPMFQAGDEFCRTQKGNNNAYCQDNEISWVDWHLLREHADLHDFVKRLIAFRKKHPVLNSILFPNHASGGGSSDAIFWYGPDGRDPDWEHGQAVACVFDGSSSATGVEDDDPVLLLINASGEDVNFTLPPLAGGRWQVAFGTEESTPSIDPETGTVTLGEQALCALAGVSR